MTTMDAVDMIVKRADERLVAHQLRIHVESDAIFAKLLVGEWLFGVLVALVFSPYAWEGKQSSIHAHVYIAAILGLVIISLPVALARLRPGAAPTRHVIAMGQMLFAALLVHLTGGRIETHFLFFGSFAFLSFYRDWKVLLTATVVVATEHLIRGLVWPESIYGITNPEWWRFLEHAFWVLFCNAFLTMACVRGVREMRQISEREAEVEAMSEGEWRKSSIVDRAQVQGA